MHISFSVSKAETSTPDTANISLWNLNPEQLAILSQPDCVVTLKAGYETTLPLIFVGAVTFTETVLDGPDRETRIEASDGGIELRDTYISLSYAGKIGSKKIIEDVAAQMGVAISFSYNATFYEFPTGFSVVGSARVALDKACASNGLAWQVQNGILQVKKKGDTMTQEVFQLSAETGLIGAPKAITYGSDASGGENKSGYEIDFLMNGAVSVGDLIALESKYVKGVFSVYSLAITGDNLAGDWICTAKILAAQGGG